MLNFIKLVQVVELFGMFDMPLTKCNGLLCRVTMDRIQQWTYNVSEPLLSASLSLLYVACPRSPIITTHMPTAHGMHVLSWFVPQLSMIFQSLTSTSNGSVSDPPGLSAYFSFYLTDSHMTFVCSHYLSLLDTLNPPCLHFDLEPSSLTQLHIPDFWTLPLTAV